MTTLVDVAFGDDPGRWPLPSAATPEQRWLRAVAAGGQGRYGSALTELDALRRSADVGRYASLAHSARASFLRQLGGHDHARTWDGRAWATAGSDPDAAADALIGLAADALGTGRFAASERLLRRAQAVVGVDTSARLPVRLSWVSAELSMFTGNGTAAVQHAERAVELAERTGSTRHVVKSEVVLAAALCSAGDVDGSRRVAHAALAATSRSGLVPLNWALASLLADVGSAVHSPARIAGIRDESADTVRKRGGAWSAC